MAPFRIWKCVLHGVHDSECSFGISKLSKDAYQRGKELHSEIIAVFSYLI